MIKNYILNQKIKDKELRVIMSDGKNLGVISTTEALKKAQEKGLDLVIISPNSKPPVAKILDYKKFLYQESKDKSKSKTHSRKSETKEIMFKPFTAEGDLKWQMDRAKKWLAEGNRVKVWVAMKGRQLAHPEICFEKIERFRTGLENDGKPEGKAERKGNIVSLMFAPK